MARAATKRNRGAKATPRPVTAQRRRGRRKEKTLEDQLFFSRLRGHAKWAFVFLAVIFAGSFVFLGVGSGNAGLGDVFTNVFGGSSGPSISDLESKVAANPRDRQAVSDLSQALESKGRVDDAITAYREYLGLRPKDTEALNSLALLYQSKADGAARDANAALQEASIAAPGAQFRPGSGTLGEAIGSQIDPLAQAASQQADTAYQEAVARYRAANRESLDIYRKLVKLQPGESTALLAYARAADAADDPGAALAAYRKFVKGFPQDELVRDVKKRIAQIVKQQKAQAGSANVPSNAGGATG